jgi:hypothetical protein
MFFKDTIRQDILELLVTLQSRAELQDFHLAGGTSLAMQLGHRKSIDLDLFTQNDFNSNTLLEFLEEHYGFKMYFSSANTLKGQINDVNVDFITHKYPFVDQLICSENIRLFSIPDIAAMKLNAIAGNGTRSKDFIDMYFILKRFEVKDILFFYKKKYTERNQFHALKSLNYFEEISMADWPEMILEKNLNLQNVKKSISKHVMTFSESLKK